MSSCGKKEKEEDDVIMCYIAPPPQESVISEADRLLPPTENQIDFSEIGSQ